MNRKDFLKNLGLAGIAAVAAPLLTRCVNNSKECSVTNTEMEGPYPNKSPSSLVQSNIVNDRTGIPLTIAITVQNVNAKCTPLRGAFVDIWHCDKDGNYSEYGGTKMQPIDYGNVHFLRGRQATNSNGQVNFTSIFPGWYKDRATHIHVHVYNSEGKSLLVTQVAFPEGKDSAVVQVAASTGYKGMNGYTYNANDMVFKDGTSNEMSSISGSISGGFTLAHTIKVSA